MKNLEKNGAERRRFFRIDDEVYLDYELVTDEQYSNAPQELEDIENSAFSMTADFATLNYEYNPILNSIRSTSPDIAQYLELLNNKIDAISQQLLDEDSPFNNSDPVEVNISASGIAFKCNDDIKDNQGMRLKLVLLPEKIGIIVYGRVKHELQSKEQKQNNIICIDFEHIRYDDKELMIKHNLNKQMLELRKRSEDDED